MNNLGAFTQIKKMNPNRKIRIMPEKYKNFLLVLPFMALVFAFSYLPLYGWLFAFYDYKIGLKLSQCEFKGLYFFSMLFSDPISSAETLRVLKNTIGISFLNLLATPLPMIFAVFLVEIKTGWFKKVVQTLTTMPNFLSWILVYTFAFSMFSVDQGFVNKLLMGLNLINAPTNLLASQKHVWLIQTAFSIWKSLGWSAIIYLAAIASIDREQYEAAKVDGAGRLGTIWHITLPGIIPTYFVMLLLAVASFLNNGIQQYFVFQNSMNKDTIEVLDLYVYNIGIKNGMMGFNYSFATAIGVLKSLISILLLFSINFLSYKVRKQKIV